MRKSLISFGIIFLCGCAEIATVGTYRPEADQNSSPNPSEVYEIVSSDVRLAMRSMNYYRHRHTAGPFFLPVLFPSWAKYNYPEAKWETLDKVTIYVDVWNDIYVNKDVAADLSAIVLVTNGHKFLPSSVALTDSLELNGAPRRSYKITFPVSSDIRQFEIEGIRFGRKGSLIPVPSRQFVYSASTDYYLVLSK